MTYLRAVGWFLRDLLRPFRGFPEGVEALVTIAYIAGGVVAAARVHEVVLRSWAIGAFVGGAILVVAVRQRYDLGVNRPSVRFQPGYWSSPRPSDLTAFREVYRGNRRIAVEKVIASDAMRYALIGVVNDPPGLREEATVRHASVKLKYEEVMPDGSLKLFLPRQLGLYGVWWDNPHPTPDTPWDSVRYRDLIPSHNDVHRIIVGRATQAGRYAAYEGSFEGVTKDGDVTVIPEGYRLVADAYLVTVTVSGTGMAKPLSEAFYVTADQDGNMVIRKGAHERSGEGVRLLCSRLASRVLRRPHT